MEGYRCVVCHCMVCCFREAFPEVEVTRVFLTLDVSQLNKLDYELTWVDRAIRYYNLTMNERSDRPVVIEKGYCCGTCVNGVRKLFIARITADYPP